MPEVYSIFIKISMTWIWTKFFVILRNRSIFVEHVPCEIKILNRLEHLLIFRRLLFKKVTIMPKGCFPKLKGKIRNITVETNDIANVLPRGADSNGLIFVKINQKLSYRGHVYLEPVSPGAVQLALVYLKQNNPFYHKIRIDIDNISMNYLIWLKT